MPTRDPVNVNVPVQITVALDGTVTLQTIKSEQYNLGPADASFTGNLRDALLDAFVVSNNQGSESPNIAVDLCGNTVAAAQANLADEMRHAPKVGTTGTANMVSLKQYLLAFATSQLNAQLATNGIADTLEADAVENGIDLPNFHSDICGGAISMFDGISALAPHIRALLATQINSSRWESASTLDSELPLFDGGDSMTFQFIITQHYAVSEEAVSNFSDPSNNNIQGVGPGVAPTHYTVATRTVDLKLVRPDPSGSLIAAYTTDAYQTADTAPVTAAQDAVDSAMGAAEVAYLAWAAKKELVDNEAAALNYKNKAQDIYTKAQLVETEAVAAQGTMQTGPLFLAAQDAIAAATAAKAHLDGKATTDYDNAVTANSGSSISLATRRSTLDNANTLVTTKHGLYVAAVATYNTAVSNDSKETAYVNWRAAQRAAHIESKLTYYANCVARYEEEVARLAAAVKATAPKSDLQVAIETCVADEADYVEKHALVVAATPANPTAAAAMTEAQVQALSDKKKDENDAAIKLRDSIAAHAALLVEVEKIVTNLNTNLGPKAEDAEGNASGTPGFTLSETDYTTDRTSGKSAYRVAIPVRVYFPYDIAPVESLS